MRRSISRRPVSRSPSGWPPSGRRGASRKTWGLRLLMPRSEAERGASLAWASGTTPKRGLTPPRDGTHELRRCNRARSSECIRVVERVRQDRDSRAMHPLDRGPRFRAPSGATGLHQHPVADRRREREEGLNSESGFVMQPGVVRLSREVPEPRSTRIDRHVPDAEPEKACQAGSAVCVK